MFDEDYDSESAPVSAYDARGGGSPPQSVMDEYEETESVIHDGGRTQMSPPQSLLEEEMEEVEDIESVYEDGDVPTRGARQINRRNLSTVPEERSMENEEEETHRSEQFINGAHAHDMLDMHENDRRKKHIIIENDPRFNNSYNPKENSWEPSPYNSRIEERENEPNRSVRGDGQSILASMELETSRTNRSASQSVKLTTKQTCTLPALTSSDSSTSTLVKSDERLRSDESPTRNTHDIVSHSRRSTAITGIPSSPVDSNISTVSSVVVSTPNDRLTKKQHTKSLREQFHDISAITENKENGTGRGSKWGPGRHPGFGEGRETREGGERGRLARGVGAAVVASSPVASADTLSTTGLIKFVQGATASTGNDLVRALDQARSTGRILKKPDFGKSASTTATISSLSSLSSLSSRQSTMAPPLSSSNSINTSHNHPIHQSTMTTTRESTRRDESYSRQSRLPDLMTSSRREEERSGRSEELGERERPSRHPEGITSSKIESNGRSVDYSREMRHTELTRREEKDGQKEQREQREQREPPPLPPRPTPRINQSTVEEPRRRSEKNTSTQSTLSTRSSQYSDSGERVESRTESVTSTTSQKSSNGHDRIIVLCEGYSKEIDFGYVNAGESKIFVLKGRNLLSFAITCRYSLKGSKNRAPPFSIMDGTEIIVPGGGSLEVKLQFTPPQVANFYDYLSIEVSGGGINRSYTILLCGKGGRAHVVLTPRSGLHPHRSSSEFLLQSGSSQTASIGVENTGKRTAYVRAVVLDGYDRRVEGVIFTPSDSFVLLPNTQQPIRVDLSQSNLNEHGRCSSSLGSNGGVRFRRSSTASTASTASVNSISSSASSASRIPPAYKIVLYSGEDSQRQRMIGWCVRHGHTSFPPLCSVDEDFSRPFVGEEPAVDKKRPNFYSSDKNLFIASITTTIINVHLSGVKYQPSMDESTEGDRTLVPDDTFRGADDTMLSMDAELTVMRIRR